MGKRTNILKMILLMLIFYFCHCSLHDTNLITWTMGWLMSKCLVLIAMNNNWNNSIAGFCIYPFGMIFTVSVNPDHLYIGTMGLLFSTK